MSEPSQLEINNPDLSKVVDLLYAVYNHASEPSQLEINNPELMVAIDLLMATCETWRRLPLDLYMSKYEVSSFGSIRNIRSGRILNKKPKDDGYIVSDLTNDFGRTISTQNHVIIASTFIANPENKQQVDHINRIRSDNRVANLRWATISENMNNRSASYNPWNKKSVYQISGLGDIVQVWESVLYLVRNSGIKGLTRDAINWAIKHEKDAYGYFWRRPNPNAITDYPGEIWRELVYKNVKIRVSSCGRIESSSGNRTFGSKRRNGYYQAKIGGITTLAHKIVCIAFNGVKPSKKHSVDHINTKKHDNRACNLRWATPTEQNLNRNNSGKGSSRAVRRVNRRTGMTTVFDSIKEAALSVVDERDLSAATVQIGEVCRMNLNGGRRKQYLEYDWYYNDT